MNMPIGSWQPSQSPLTSGNDFTGQAAPSLTSGDNAAHANEGNLLAYSSTAPQNRIMLDGNTSGNNLSQENPTQATNSNSDAAQFPQLSELLQMIIAALYQKITGAQNSNETPDSGASANNNAGAGDSAGNPGQTLSDTPQSASPAANALQQEPSQQSVNDSKSGASPAATSAPSATSANANVDPSKNSMTFENKGTEPMTIKFTPNAGGGENIPDLTLQPGESKTQQFNEGWSGNFRSTKGDGANATLGEVKFDGDSGNTFYDVSYIEGNNARMQMQPMQGGRVSGTLDDLANDAPDSIKARDAEGNVYGLKKSTNAEQIDNSVVDYYRTKVGADQGYVVPKDDASTLGSSARNLKVDLM